MEMKCTGYNQHGEGIAIYNSKVFYIPNFIMNEVADIEILEEHEKWGKGRVSDLLSVSENRNDDLPEHFEEIGGYELLHMNRKEQTNFKMSKIINDFKQNAGYEIDLRPMLVGKKQLRYRNKITLHDGCFYKKGTHDPICLDDFLLTDIKPNAKKDGDVIIRKLDTLIRGTKDDKAYTTDSMFGLKFKVSIGAFYQVNKEMALVAYEHIMKFIEKSDHVFDLYSGIGTITLLLSKHANKVTGVEKSRVSHLDAIANAQQNDIKNVLFVKNRVDRFLRKTETLPDIVVVDPAREGMKRDVCESLLGLEPKRIIYLSCNPATQAADFNRLKEKYELVYAQPIDMFPQTYHIENLIVLELKK